MNKINFKSIFLVLTLLVTLSVLGGCITFEKPNPQTPAPGEPAANVTPINPGFVLPPANGEIMALPSIADVVALVKPSVVAITTETVTFDFFNRQVTQEGAGSGWIIDPNGIIVTNNHVVENAQSINVILDNGDSYSVDKNSVATDPLNDVAILKIKATGLPAVKRGNPANLRIGDWVVAIGNALGQGTRATQGIISRLGASLEVDTGQTLINLIETTAAINPGNSGGPLVNLAGEVIGITNAKIANIGVEGMGYAIRIDTATPIIQQLVSKGFVTRPWLGVGLYTVDRLAVRQLDLGVNEGVLLLQVVVNGPAAKAGLKEGDVIVSLAGREVKSVEELTQALLASTIGQAIEIKYWRGKQQFTTTATPIENPRP